MKIAELCTEDGVQTLTATEARDVLEGLAESWDDCVSEKEALE